MSNDMTEYTTTYQAELINKSSTSIIDFIFIKAAHVVSFPNEYVGTIN